MYSNPNEHPPTVNMEKPERHGKKWEKDEEDYILGRIKQGAIPPVIANEVKRTLGAIVSHLRHMACDWIESGTSIEEAVQKTRLSVCEIQDALKRRELEKEMKELSRKQEASVRSFFLQKPAETELDVLRDIRSLLQQLVSKSETGVINL